VSILGRMWHGCERVVGCRNAEIVLPGRMVREGGFDLRFDSGRVFRPAGSGHGLRRLAEPSAAVAAGGRASARRTASGEQRPRGTTEDRAGGAGVEFADTHVEADASRVEAEDEQTVGVAEAAQLLGRDRTRIYALLRSGDLVAAAAGNDDSAAGPVRIERSSLERWLVAGGDGRSTAQCAQFLGAGRAGQRRPTVF
jgi:hypothetical protein